jgi:hypothetical protein
VLQACQTECRLMSLRGESVGNYLGIVDLGM